MIVFQRRNTAIFPYSAYSTVASVQTGRLDKEKSQQAPETGKRSKNRFRLVDRRRLSCLI